MICMRGRAHISMIQRRFSLIKATNIPSPTLLCDAESPVRVRFAPSPTGQLHLGGARTALFNWLLAKKTNGQFLIRVEDTDEVRSTRESEKSILNDIKWLNMDWDEGPNIEGPFGPYRQSERKDIYMTVINQLIKEGKAYRCFSTKNKLNEKQCFLTNQTNNMKYSSKCDDDIWRNADQNDINKKLQENIPYTIKFKVPNNKFIKINDIVRGTVEWDAKNVLGDFIIVRSNGMPVYNFCVAVDDAYMKISHVIRAEEHLTNTLRQILVLEAINSTPPRYAHCSLIFGK